jgi:regulator of sirC expression with transglutaminase-like and TPR domain
MVLGEVLGELEAGELAVGDDAVHETGLLEHDEVPVHRALRQAPAVGRLQELRDRHRPGRIRQRLHDRPSVRRHSLVDTVKTRRDRVLQSFGGRSALARCHVRSVRRNVDATERFAELVRRPPDEVPLDETALLVAKHAHPDLDLAVPLAELDRLAGDVAGASAADVAGALFGEGGLTGNTVDYGDPRNSYLDDVLARRLGIPISLSVVMIEVGRRCGVRIYGVGMPGHFLVQPAGEPDVWFDPFHGGRRLDEAGCRELYEAMGLDAPFTIDLLRAVDTRSILRRMLANLQQTFTRRDPASLAWAVRLELRIPGLLPGERRRLAGLLGGVGRFVEAAAELDAVAADLEGEDAEQVKRDATALRSRAN